MPGSGIRVLLEYTKHPARQGLEDALTLGERETRGYEPFGYSTATPRAFGHSDSGFRVSVCEREGLIEPG